MIDHIVSISMVNLSHTNVNSLSENLMDVPSTPGRDTKSHVLSMDQDH
jgi:hypothetical protein